MLTLEDLLVPDRVRLWQAVCSRRWLCQSTSGVATSTSSGPFHGPRRWISSVANRADVGLGQHVVQRVADHADVGRRTGGREPLREPNGRVLGGLSGRSSQHPDRQGCDVGTNCSVGVVEDRPGADAFAGAATAAA